MTTTEVRTTGMQAMTIITIIMEEITVLVTVTWTSTSMMLAISATSLLIM
jgi:hypothetical protein